MRCVRARELLRVIISLSLTLCACLVLFSLELVQVTLFVGLKLTDTALYTTMFFQIACTIPLPLSAARARCQSARTHLLV